MNVTIEFHNEGNPTGGHGKGICNLFTRASTLLSLIKTFVGGIPIFYPSLSRITKLDLSGSSTNFGCVPISMNCAIHKASLPLPFSSQPLHFHGLLSFNVHLHSVPIFLFIFPWTVPLFACNISSPLVCSLVRFTFAPIYFCCPFATK